MADIFTFHVYDDRTIQYTLAEPIMLEDTNVTQFKFRIPKSINGFDMTDWAWWFVYVNPSQQKYSVPLAFTDDEDEPDEYANAVYTVDYGMSATAGTVQFALEAINADATTSEVLNEWHTKTYSTRVISTLQGNETEFEQSEIDIISGMIQDMLSQIREMIDEGGVGGGTSDDVENKSSVSGATVTDALGSLNDQITNIQGGAPKTVSTVAQMVDTTQVYLYTGSETGYTAGHWYYYSGGSWVDGGKYGAVNSNVFSDYAKQTLITILRSAMYTSDQSGNISRLEDALARQVTAIGATIDLGGNTIYTDDELDTLRQYLTVTATYEDMTTSPVTGYALSGTLVAGTSTITITYQGNSTTVSIPVSQAVVRYAITYSLTGVTSSNTDTTIAEGNTYTTTLTAETAGYIPTEVAVTMGGTDVTATAYDASTHVVSIANVSGAISITAVEAEDPTAPVYKLTTPTTFDTTTTPIDTGIKLLDTEDSDWTVCAEIEVLTDTTNGSITTEESRNNYNSFYARISHNGPLRVLFMDKSSNVGTTVWVGEKAGNTAKYVVTHVAGSLDVNVHAIATNVKGVTDNRELTITGAAYRPSDDGVRLKVGTCSSGSYSVKNCYVYRRVIDSSEITAYMS